MGMQLPQGVASCRGRALSPWPRNHVAMHLGQAWRAYNVMYEPRRNERKQQVSTALVGIIYIIGGVDGHQQGELHRPGNACCDGAGAPVPRQLRTRTQKGLMTNLDEGKARIQFLCHSHVHSPLKQHPQAGVRVH